MPAKLAPTPRLYVSAQQLAQLTKPIRHPQLQLASEKVAQTADLFATAAEIDYPRNTHNELLLRARRMQRCIVTLLVRYFQTGERTYRDAALRHVGSMGKWPYWSWITWRQKNADPLAIFDLSYGENSATLAIAYDWLRSELSDDERQLFIDIAWRRSFESFLKHTQTAEKGKCAWWFHHAYSNWNTVCAGGAGMLALAMHDDLPQAATVLQRADASVKPYMQALRQSSGAWPEGIGYWNYGMRYAFMYLLSHENATGRKHPLLRQEATRQTLLFPLEFSPHGIGCSFGDVNRWGPLPIHFAVAQRLGMKEVLSQLESRLQQSEQEAGFWPGFAELLLLHPGKTPAKPRATKRVAKLYKGQDWGWIADRMPEPTMYAAVRGGTTEVPHGHRDLTSFHAVVNGEALITNLGVGEYLDTTFSPRRWELFETMPASKNMVLINGVGIAGQTQVVTSVIKSPRAVGFRIDSTRAYAPGGYHGGAPVKFTGRMVLLLKDNALLILDAVQTPHPARVETRFHSFAQVKLDAASAKLTRNKVKGSMSFASTQNCELLTAVTAPTSPGPSANVLRWRTKQLHTQMVFAALLTADSQPAQVELESAGSQLRVRVNSRRVLAVNSRLRLVD